MLIHSASTLSSLSYDPVELLDEEFDVDTTVIPYKRIASKRPSPWLYAEAGWDEEATSEPAV